MYVFLDPLGLFRPAIAVINATAVVVSWTTPQEPNGIILGYNVSITLPTQSEQIFVASLSTTLTIVDLTPFTSYVVRIIAFNSVGSVVSNGTSFTTAESGMKYNYTIKIYIWIIF